MKKSERQLFFTGLAGVVLIVAVGFYLPCPSITQSWYLSIALGLMAALVASQIPGVLHVDLNPAASARIKAGGAIAVFVMIVFVKPAAIGASDDERRFSNTSCQGPVPEGKVLSKDKLPDELDPAKTGAISTAGSLKRPVKFVFNYPHGELAGPRYWTQVKEGVWIETYPNAELFTAFREVGRTTHSGCEGIVVERQDNSGFKVFIPDIGCANMWLWMQFQTEQWSFLGRMESVA